MPVADCYSCSYPKVKGKKFLKYISIHVFKFSVILKNLNLYNGSQIYCLSVLFPF